MVWTFEVASDIPEAAAVNLEQVGHAPQMVFIFPFHHLYPVVLQVLACSMPVMVDLLSEESSMLRQLCSHLIQRI